MAPTPDTSTALTPPLAARLRDVKSSPVRDILALTEKPGVISFAGGLPAPELFDAAGLRASFAAVLADGGAAGRSLQYSTTEGDPALRSAVAELLTGRGLPTSAEDLLITSGSQQALTLDCHRPARAGRSRPRRGAVLPRRAPGVRAGRRHADPRPLRRGRHRRRGRWTASPPSTHPSCCTRSPRSRTRPGARCRSSAARRSPSSRSAAACGSSRTTPTASCATPASRCRRSHRCRAPRTGRSRSRRCRRSPPPDYGSAGSARPSSCAVR